MEKGKGIDIELTEEDLRMELQRLRREIQETRERRIKVEFATVVARAENAALDAELEAKMTKCDVISKKTVVVRKEHDAFKNDITMRLQKIRGKCSYFNEEANSGPEDTHPRATEEDADEEIIYMPPFLRRLKGGDKKITLSAYERTHSVEERVVPCALIYEHLKVSEECVELKAAIRNLINIREIPYLWGENTVLTCDQPEPSMPVTKHTRFYCHYFMPFKKTLLDIYSQLVQKGVLASVRKDDEAIDLVGIEIWKPYPYHDAIDHNIGRCLRFCYEAESLVNMGKIQVKSKGPTDSFPSQSSQKGKAAMGDNNEKTSLTDIVMAHPALAHQNELILQLMQQIAEMRVEM
uniref:Uncharacterized protein n=1 Tax=Solanum tuberosum TaxID=4113 RepID=M1DN57_SOLTU